MRLNKYDSWEVIKNKLNIFYTICLLLSGTKVIQINVRVLKSFQILIEDFVVALATPRLVLARRDFETSGINTTKGRPLSWPTMLGTRSKLSSNSSICPWESSSMLTRHGGASRVHFILVSCVVARQKFLLMLV